MLEPARNGPFLRCAAEIFLYVQTSTSRKISLHASNCIHFSQVLLVILNLKKKRVYLDYASATPVRKQVVLAMQPYFNNFFGNAGAIHQEGVAARNVIEHARGELASLLRVRQNDVIFTGSGTESNNLAILGTLEAKRKEGVPYTDMEIISTRIEHPSVLEVLSYVEKLGVAVTYVTVDEFGLIDINVFKESLTQKTVLVTFAYVNSEIGVIQRVAKLARIVRACEKEFGNRIYVHVDAAQAPLWLPCALDALMVDLLSLDAGKCYGPKGVGVLVKRHGVTLTSVMFGGEQEGGLRPGTENTPLIVGAVRAIQIAQEKVAERSTTVKRLRDAFMVMVEEIEGVVVNGSKEDRVANNVNISIPGTDSEFAVITLDEKGIACSTKSACGGARGDGSAVVRTVTGDGARATSTIRFTLGEDTTLAEIACTTKILAEHVAKTRAALEKLTVQ